MTEKTSPDFSVFYPIIILKWTLSITRFVELTWMHVF